MVAYLGMSGVLEHNTEENVSPLGRETKACMKREHLAILIVFKEIGQHKLHFRNRNQSSYTYEFESNCIVRFKRQTLLRNGFKFATFLFKVCHHLRKITATILANYD